MSPDYASQFVNSITKKNFTNYINHYRIETTKKMILDAEFKNYSHLTLGLESGCISKKAFYKAFKKVTGITPKAYRNSN
ncbi:helix-turn-helix domain-containing protein [uncultured Aquimarina sp.]|uniref:helix-turn-helix domain-containing protein n=1 Tax=uncultured Aquimarina sp. TaxID=575652 RepID=UPI0034242111